MNIIVVVYWHLRLFHCFCVPLCGYINHYETEIIISPQKRRITKLLWQTPEVIIAFFLTFHPYVHHIDHGTADDRTLVTLRWLLVLNCLGSWFVEIKLKCLPFESLFVCFIKLYSNIKSLNSIVVKQCQHWLAMIGLNIVFFKTFRILSYTLQITFCFSYFETTRSSILILK